MTKRTIGIIFFVVTSIVLVAIGVYYSGQFLSKKYAPPNIIVTKNKIISSGGFMDPVTVEKLRVDSLGKDKRPTKYTIEYVTTCFIKQKDGQPPVALKEIKLNEPGSYSWSDENVYIAIYHPDGFSKRIDSAQRSTLSMGRQKFDICPIKFETGNWYFINFQDPVFVGVYVYVDKTGTLQQYSTFSDRLPI